ncbi:MAG: N-acetyltransferase [Paludibacteraceae bacterium]|nr:N-acetyltransferase [Paludibacteraceae bacterium]
MLEIRPVTSRRDLRRFIDFANDLYKDCEYWCPPLYFDELNVFNRKKNPAMEFCDYQLFMAYRDGTAVGRIAAIINYKANERWGADKVRFGWMDFVDDLEVSRALLDQVAEWGRGHGMKEMNGPVGFTDFDHEGLLIEGYEYLAPMASLYNFPYYVRHMEAYGLVKEADWIEFLMPCPMEVPERMRRMAQIAAGRSKVHIDKVKSPRELVRKYGLQFMDVLDAAYQQLYNFQPMTRRQKEYYRDMYFPLLNFDFVSIVANDAGECVAVGLGMPDISKALRKCGGKLFPFGWYYLLKALKTKHIEHFDLLLIGVRPDYQNKGVNALIFNDMIPYFAKYGVREIETTSILETNLKNQANFEYFNPKLHKRRRAYIKAL